MESRKVILINRFSGQQSLAVQWLRFHASNAGVPGLIPGQGTKIPTCPVGQTKNKKKKLFFNAHILRIV